MRRYLFVISWIVLGCATGASAQVEVRPAFPNLTFEAPVDIQHPGDGTDRLFVVEKPGVIRVFDNDSAAVSAGVFLDIRDRVDDSGGEMGLLGLAFHPDYETNGYFFVDYTAGSPRRTVIARYEVDASDPNRADPDSETIILEVDQPYGNHNGGQIQFGPDGYLYIALGDGGSGGDPDENGQDRSTLLGSLLRIDVDATSGEQNYVVPTDNPLVAADCGPAACKDEIWAYGLRNPWRFSFDPADGTLWLADVGQAEWEEVDLIEKGGNYGWDVMEGTHCYEPSSGCDETGLILPIFEYSHTVGRSVTGGYVYRGSDVPDLHGRYVFADFGSGRIWTISADDPESGAARLLDSGLAISTFGVDAQGELYLTDYAGTNSTIYRFAAGDDTGVDEREQPETFATLAPASPNPFRHAATLTYTLDRTATVELSIYDVRGSRIRALSAGVKTAGTYEVTWDGMTLEGAPAASGIYLAQLLVDGVPAAAQRMVKLPE